MNEIETLRQRIAELEQEVERLRERAEAAEHWLSNGESVIHVDHEEVSRESASLERLPGYRCWISPVIRETVMRVPNDLQGDIEPTYYDGHWYTSMESLRRAKERNSD